MAYVWRSIPIELLQGDYEAAFDHATEKVRRGREGIDKEKYTGEYRRYVWGKLDINLHGALAEIAYQRMCGVPDPALRLGTLHNADFRGVEVKSTCWTSAETCDNWEGGYMHVPPWTKAGKVVRISIFAATIREMAFYDGGLSMPEIRRFPLEAKHGKVYRVPYEALRI